MGGGLSKLVGGGTLPLEKGETEVEKLINEVNKLIYYKLS